MGDLSDWKPLNLTNLEDMFNEGDSDIDLMFERMEDIILSIGNMPKKKRDKLEPPYWALIENDIKRKEAINSYWLKEELEADLNSKNIKTKKIKI